jgi:hypothetical protein
MDFTGLPADVGVSLAVKCACFADKYNIIDFVDEAMAFLFDEEVEVTLELLRLIFETTSKNCPLREILAEKTTAAVEAGKIEEFDLLRLDGIGFLPLYISFHGALHLCLEADATQKASVHASVLSNCFRGARRTVAKSESACQVHSIKCGSRGCN